MIPARPAATPNPRRERRAAACSLVVSNRGGPRTVGRKGRSLAPDRPRKAEGAIAKVLAEASPEDISRTLSTARIEVFS